MNNDKCGYMILTPTPEHNGGMWCADVYPCSKHGEWDNRKAYDTLTKALENPPEPNEALKKIFETIGARYKWDTPFTGILKEYSGFIHAGVARQLQSAHEGEIERVTHCHKDMGDGSICTCKLDCHLHDWRYGDEEKAKLLQSLISEVDGLQQYDMEIWPGEDSWITKQEKGEYVMLDDILALLRKRLK